MKYQNNHKLIVNRIESQKANRYKNIYLFTLSVTPEEEKNFNNKLKELINELSNNNKEQLVNEPIKDKSL